MLDLNTGSGLEYVIVTATDLSTGKIADGAKTDSTGSFAITGLSYGSYKIAVDFVGYRPYRFDSITLNKAHPQIVLKTVKLRAQAHNLSDVVITGNAPIVDNKIDKVVYNVANDITSQGGVVLDVLKKVPQVSVDADGNVEVQGNANVRFLINGKPSGIFGSSLADALSSIPASQIKSIEVITSPGAKYDAQGTGGIINIILRNDRFQGLSGNINMSAGTRTENASVNLSMHRGNFGMNVFFSGNGALKARSPYQQTRSSYNSADQTTTRFSQDGYYDLTRAAYESGIGLDWDVSKNNALSGSFQFDHFNNQRNGVANQEEIVSDNAGSIISDLNSIRNSASKTNISSYDWSLNYKHLFKHKGDELDALYSASFGRPGGRDQQDQSYTSATVPYEGTSSTNPGTDRQTNISIDYVRKQDEHTTIEAGVKSSFQNINSTTEVNILYPANGEYVHDPLQSYEMNYKTNIYAGYVSGSFYLFQFLKVKTGLRVEHTDVTIDYHNLQIPSYNIYAPSVILSHDLDEMRSVKLAYTYRIERPEYDELNPFINLSDPYNITTGNPLLRPEIEHHFELGYSCNLKRGGNIYIAFMERFNTHDKKPYTQFYTEYAAGDSVYKNVSVTTRRNIGEEYNSGLILSGSLPLFGKVNIRGNCMLFSRHIINSFDTVATITNGFNWRLNMNINYEISGNMVAEAFGNYRSPFNNIQGKNPQFLTYTIAFRKQFWNKKASIGCTGTNIFNHYVKQVITTNIDNYRSYLVRELPFRSVGLTFTYKFGKRDQKLKEHILKDPGLSPDN